MPVRNRRLKPAQSQQHGGAAFTEQAEGSTSEVGDAQSHQWQRQQTASQCPLKADGQRQKHRPFHKHKRLWIITGILTCMLAAVLVQQAHETQRVQELLAQFQQLNLTLSSNFNATITDLLAHLPAFSLPALPAVMQQAEPSVGELLAQQGLQAKHTVIIVPGFVTTGLELWLGRPCAMRYFRQRMWGTLTMAQAFLLDKDCWFEHMALDPATGLDPPGIKIRPASGVEAVDYILPGYWVFGRLVEALAAIGYDHNNLVSMPYDWRLSLPHMELRDAYFSRLKAACELHVRLSGLRVVLLSHSYGAVVVQSFLHWAEDQQAGWTEQHVESWANVAGVTLGLPKAVSALLSGEMRDTAQLMSLAAYLTDSMMMPRARRAQLFRSWGSVLAMLPVGGPQVWGNGSWAPDDEDLIRRHGRSYGAMVAAVSSASSSMRGLALDQSDEISGTSAERASAASGASKATPCEGEDSQQHLEHLLGLKDTVLEWFSKLAQDFGAHGGEDEPVGSSDGKGLCSSGGSGCSGGRARGPGSKGGDGGRARRQLLHAHDAVAAVVEAVGGSFKQHLAKWSALDVSGIPDPPAAKGSGGGGRGSSGGSPDELGRQLQQPARGRVPVKVRDPTTTPLPQAPSTKIFCLYGVGKPTERAYHYLKNEPAGEEELPLWRINTLASHPESGLDMGVQTADGDGTVPLLSLGLMCYKGWRSRRLNPARMRVVSREYRHQPVPLYRDVRGGPSTADHVDILGNQAMLADVLHIAAGRDLALRDQVVSGMQRIAANVGLWDK